MTELKVKLMTELHPRECLVRVLANGQVAPCIKAMTVDAPVSAPRAAPSPQGLVKAKQVLPEKFVEGAVGGTREVQFSPGLLEKVERSEAAESQVENPLPARSVGALRDLLAMHSSSRQQVNKKEDRK